MIVIEHNEGELRFDAGKMLRHQALWRVYICVFWVVLSLDGTFVCIIVFNPTLEAAWRQVTLSGVFVRSREGHFSAPWVQDPM